MRIPPKDSTIWLPKNILLPKSIMNILVNLEIRLFFPIPQQIESQFADKTSLVALLCGMLVFQSL